MKKEIFIPVAKFQLHNVIFFIKKKNFLSVIQINLKLMSAEFQLINYNRSIAHHKYDNVFFLIFFFVFFIWKFLS